MTSNSSYSDNSCNWKELYGSALLELDTRKLPERIAAARCAIFDRAEAVRDILQSTTDAFSARDKNSRYIYANEKAVQLLGESHDLTPFHGSAIACVN